MQKFTKLDLKAPLSTLEKEVQEYWQNHDIINKSFTHNNDKEEFVFFDGFKQKIFEGRAGERNKKLIFKLFLEEKL